MESITGYVDHIVFQNSENGYTVMILMMEGEEVTCVGMCKGLGQGENITAEGEYIEHPVYGRQFKIQNYETVTPRNGKISGIRCDPRSGRGTGGPYCEKIRR